MVMAVLTYQWFNYLCNLLSTLPILGSVPANFLFRCFVRFVVGPLMLWALPGKLLSPNQKWSELCASCNYGYYYLWNLTPAQCKFNTEGYLGWDVGSQPPQQP